MSGSGLKTWLHRVGYLTTITVVAAAGYVGYLRYRDWKQPHRPAAASDAMSKPPVVKPVDGLSRDDPAIWTVSMRSSSNPQPRIERVCMGTEQRAEMWACSGWVSAPDGFEPAIQTASCTSEFGTQTRSVTVSNDARFIRDRREYKSVPAYKDPYSDTWEETTMAYVGACPAPLKKDQGFYVIRPDGKVIDPSIATTCMVAVLKAVPGVTAPKAGYIWDPKNGPLPFVRYTYPSRHGRRPIEITFLGDGYWPPSDPSPMGFSTTMSGVFSVNDKGPDTYGADEIMPLWKARCGVDAGINSP